MDEAREAEVMVAMQVRDENVVDPSPPDLVFRKLYLGVFAAIHQEKLIVYGNHLCCWVPVEGRQGRIISEDRYTQHASLFCFFRLLTCDSQDLLGLFFKKII
jgi:hypothetical protein